MNDAENSDAGNPEAGESKDGWATDEEFLEWIKVPANTRTFDVTLRRMVLGEFGEMPPELLAQAQSAIDKRTESRRLHAVTEKYEALLEALRSPAGTMEAEERLRQCNALLDGLTDALLETPEPHRTRFLKELLPIRDQIRALRVDPG